MAGGSSAGKRKGDGGDKSGNQKKKCGSTSTEDEFRSEGIIISIYVKTFTEETISLEVRSEDSIGDVKVKILAKKGIPLDQQALIFNKMVLDDTNIIGDFDIHNNSTLKLMCKSNGFMRVFVKIPKRTTISLEVKPSDTVSKLKTNIWDKEGIPIEEQALIFNDMVLEDSGTLVDFHIKKDSTLKLMFKSRGSMKLYVKTLTTGTISLFVKPMETISNVKNKIQFQVRIPCDEQVLIFNEMVLDDSSTLGDFNINRESTLTLMRKSRGLMRIYAKTLTGNTITLQVKPLDTVYDLKAMIKEKEGHSICEQRLIFCGKQLQDELVLADYNIREESVLHVLLRLSGS